MSDGAGFTKASSWSDIWSWPASKASQTRFNRRSSKPDIRRGGEVKVSATTAGVDDRTNDCACGAHDVAVPVNSNFYVFK